MTKEEQDDHLGCLLVEERNVQKELACLQSKARQVDDAMGIILKVLSSPGDDFSQIKTLYSSIQDVDVGQLISTIEAVTGKLAVIRREIENIG